MALCLIGVIAFTSGAEIPGPPQVETWDYTIRYKYGPVVMKAGSARYQLRGVEYERKPAAKLSVQFRTNAFFDKIFLIRDTLTAYAALPGYVPRYHTRAVHEGNTHFMEEMWTRSFGKDYTEIDVRRIRNGKTQIDTTLSVPNVGYDFLNIFLFLRQLDYDALRPGESWQIATFAGDKKSNLILRYAGPTTVQRKNLPDQEAYFLAVDIANEVFSESKNAMEIWISDDAYHVPIKMRAKLKIGAAEVELI
jgi:hypothetical protein